MSIFQKSTIQANRNYGQSYSSDRARKNAFWASENFLINSLQPELRLKIQAKTELNTFGDVDNFVPYPVALNFYDIEFITK